jgi:hypothetical protein
MNDTNPPASDPRRPAPSPAGAAAPPAPVAAPADLSEEIVLMMDKRPADRVTCRRIYGDHYRCNWWAPAIGKEYDNPAMAGLMVTTHRVRQSRFLTATKTATGLVLSDVGQRVRG